MDKIVTVLTPTYNRSNTLPKLYESLQAQTDLRFEWLIIDDGSTDDTEKVVREWLRQAQFATHYYKKKNGGKQTAVNFAHQFLRTPLTFIVDSDDWLTEDAIEVIISCYDKYKSMDNLCGYSFWRVYPDGHPNGLPFPRDEMIASFFESRVLGRISGDKAEVFVTDILKKYPFPEYPTETYYPEDGVWLRMSGPYKMVHINRGIYVGEYLDGGITKAGYGRRIGWAKGWADRASVYLSNPCPVDTLLKQSILLIVYGLFAHYSLSNLFSMTHKKGMFITCLPVGGVVYLLWRIKYAK